MKCSFKPYEGNQSYIFISYSHKDSDRVFPVLEHLNNKGFRIWYDEGIEWGSEWPDSIAEHLSKAAVCIIFHSTNSVVSINCRQEAYYALKENKGILSVYLENVELSKGLDMQLSSFQSTFMFQYEDLQLFYERLENTRLIQCCHENSLLFENEKVLTDKENLIEHTKEYVTNNTYTEQEKDSYSQKIINDFFTLKNGFLLRKKDCNNKDLKNIKNIKIPDGVTTIGNYAFIDCIDLTSIEIPDSVTTIGESAFSGCTNLTSIEIPGSVTTIGESAFYYCTNLTSVKIPDSVTTIGESAFSGCKKLTSLKLPDSVTAIGNMTFLDCTNLTSIEILGSVTTIGESAFSGCTNLTSIEIPGSVTTIEESAFSYCTNLTSAKIPGSVITIGKGAFLGCTNLTSVEIPDSVTTIGNGAFCWCTNLTIYCYENSYAMEYAKDNNITYRIIKD